ncbi:MAG: hypothetical protein K9L85_03965 [Candidatus Peribacteraceae bacterium]|nr:hypothetical protein [Candidatus Peribacteraceae bacterium]
MVEKEVPTQEQIDEQNKQVAIQTAINIEARTGRGFDVLEGMMQMSRADLVKAMESGELGPVIPLVLARSITQVKKELGL